ncbi:MAG: GNAT family N-acetyltransferase [Negativicutes bacterium]|nr:GNAT family N-acetyltransferase [Negativicutes bacterium]MDR3591022.1 GNAT family N-acetyltransferase [Negativicutes bacterium]
MPQIISADNDKLLDAVASLFREYAASLGFDLSFQGFEEELANLPGEYAPPYGRLLLLLQDGKPVGCVALRRLDAGIAEMKRLYLQPSCRGRGYGQLLAQAIIQEAIAAGYRTMRLDSLASMSAAITLYQSMGFTPIPAYRYNPVQGAIYLEKEL